MVPRTPQLQALARHSSLAGWHRASTCSPFARLDLNCHLDARTPFDARFGDAQGNHNADLHEIFRAAGWGAAARCGEWAIPIRVLLSATLAQEGSMAGHIGGRPCHALDHG